MRAVCHFALAVLGILCAASPAAREPASEVRHLEVGNIDRTYRLHRPTTLAANTAVPLVIMLHGGFGSGGQAEGAYGWDELADREGFLVAYPDGLHRSWNAGGMCCGPALRNQVDDTGFLDRLIETLIAHEGVDPARVYLTGMSNGAAMAYRYACAGEHRLAAIGPVAGTFSLACSRPQPVSVLAIHGLADEHVPFAGGQGTKGVTRGEWVPVPRTIAAFRQASRCGAPLVRQDGPVHRDSASCEEGRDVVLLTIEAAGHQWPGPERRSLGQRTLGADPPSRALDATQVLWAFFAAHRSRRS